MDPDSLAQAPRGTLGTVRNAMLLLDLLSEGPPYQQLTDLAERSGLSLPTVHRLLRSLAVSGLVEQDPASLRYGLGPELVRLPQRPGGAPNELRPEPVAQRCGILLDEA